MDLRNVKASRLILPLREGGSLPVLIEADDGFKYVLKMQGSGHGKKSLIAEYIGGEIARALGFKVPELVLADLPIDFGRTESDFEVQDLLKKSVGTNLGMHFLSGALTLDPYSNPVNSQLASEILWLDAYLTNVDRTVKNTNMLVWYGEPWLIDHGASLYFHHAWSDPEKAALSPFPYVKDHVFLRKASDIQLADTKFKAILTDALISDIIDSIPSAWLEQEGVTPEEMRKAYYTFLTTRLSNSNIFVDHATSVRRVII